ncbi:MAG: nitroreductase family protein [Thermodesulfobacteriota bacterium]
MENITELIRKTRTVRRFQKKKIPRKKLVELLEFTRLGGSARNSQPLRYMVLSEEKHCDRIFPLLGWAGYLKDWPGPDQGERPAAYIICLLDLNRCKGPECEAHFDLGIGSQNLLLGAAQMNIFGCRIGSFSKSSVSRIFKLDERFKPLLVIALGYPAEEVVLEETDKDGDIRYWRDDQGIHHVPKRSLSDILLEPVFLEENSE